MVCESWKTKLDSYLDGELPEQELRTFDAHVRGCSSCSTDALARVQMKRAIQVAGKRFVPSSEFRQIEREGDLSLEPGFHSMPIRGDHVHRR